MAQCLILFKYWTGRVEDFGDKACSIQYYFHNLRKWEYRFVTGTVPLVRNKLLVANQKLCLW